MERKVNQIKKTKDVSSAFKIFPLDDQLYKITKITSEEADLTPGESEVCIHTGGPSIIEEIRRDLAIMSQNLTQFNVNLAHTNTNLTLASTNFTNELSLINSDLDDINKELLRSEATTAEFTRLAIESKLLRVIQIIQGLESRLIDKYLPHELTEGLTERTKLFRYIRQEEGQKYKDFFFIPLVFELVQIIESNTFKDISKALDVSDYPDIYGNSFFFEVSDDYLKGNLDSLSEPFPTYYHLLESIAPAIKKYVEKLDKDDADPQTQLQ